MKSALKKLPLCMLLALLPSFIFYQRSGHENTALALMTFVMFTLMWLLLWMLRGMHPLGLTGKARFRRSDEPDGE